MITIRKTLHITIILVLFAVISGCEKRDVTQTDGVPQKGDLSELMSSMNIMPLAEPQIAPEFKLLSIDSQVKSLRQYRGKVVLLNFWATW